VRTDDSVSRNLAVRFPFILTTPSIWRYFLELNTLLFCIIFVDGQKCVPLILPFFWVKRSCRDSKEKFPKQKVFPAKESVVSDISDGDGKTDILFLQCIQ
jgi:hypothetical protein